MRFAALVVLLCACSSSPERREYRQSAFPSAPAFNPVTDSPITTGQPGYVGSPERLPRGTDRRRLPETPNTRKEPGLWASGGPDVVDMTEPRLLGVLLPLPDESDTDDRATALRCAAGMSTMVTVASGRSVDAAISRAAGLSAVERSCIAASLYLACLQTMRDHYDAELQKGDLYNPETLAGLKRLTETAKRFRDTSCHHAPVSPDGDLLRRQTLEIWHREIKAVSNER